MTRILVVDDEATIRDTLQLNLEKEGYDVATASDGAEALEMARAADFDLIILDLMLPELDGLTVCRVIRREQDTPIIMLTARTGEIDKIVGLESGADDYVVKPFSLGELLARVRAVLRRAPTETRRDILEAGNLRLDLIARRATLGGDEIVLTPKEFDLLAELVRNQGAVLSRDLVLTRVWGYDYLGDSRTVDVHIRWLREKIEEDPSNPQRIQTVRGVGYRFEG
jgi:DNA-binding response OmpR family regulator